MSGRLPYPGTPRHRKRMSSRRLVCCSLAFLVCVITGYLIAPYKHPSQKFHAQTDPSGLGRTVLTEIFDGVTPSLESSSSQLDDKFVEPVVPFVNPTKENAELRQSEFCTNGCNSSDIYRRLWYEGRIRENSRMFQPDLNADDDPYRGSIETNVVTKEFRVVIKVLAFNRLESLSRCLLSLAKADYGGDNVNIQIFIDHFRYAEIMRNESFEKSSWNSSAREEPSSSSSSSSLEATPIVEGRVKRLLWGLFNRDPVQDMQDSAKPVDAADFGHRTADERNLHNRDVREELAGRLPDDSGPQAQDSGVHESAVAATQSSVDVQHEGQGDVKDDFVRRALETKSLDEQLEESHAILNFVDNFWWSHGTKEIHYRSQNVGLQAQWIESWWPVDLDEFAFIVEDDMEMSNLYYRFLRSVIATYYYNPEQYDPSVYGVSLQRPRFVPGKGGLPLRVSSNKNLFMYPMIGTWGQLLFPRQWKEFRFWYDKQKSKGEKPVLEGMVTNSWYKKLGERIWTPWFVKFTHTRGYFNLYTNFFDEHALSVSHREPGSNYKKAAGPDSQLIVTNEEGNDTMLWVMSPSKSLPRFDFCFREVKTWSIAEALPELSAMLTSMEMMDHSVLLVNIIEVHSTLVRNWLCHMERLGLRKFILLGDDNELTGDLARRGYAAISSKLFTEAETAETPRLRRDMIAVQAVHEVLALGYSVWLTRADTVWVHNPFNFELDTRSGDVIMGSQPLDRFHPALLYIRASQGILRVWSTWVGNMSVKARDDLIRKNSSSSSVWLGFQDFLTSSQNCHYLALPSGVAGSFRDLLLQTSERSPIGASGKKVILLNGIQGRNLRSVVRALKAADLWTIDKDLACKRVYC